MTGLLRRLGWSLVAGSLLLAGCGSTASSGPVGTGGNTGGINLQQVGLGGHTALASLNPGSQSLTGFPTNVGRLQQPINVPTFTNNGTTISNNSFRIHGPETIASNPVVPVLYVTTEGQPVNVLKAPRRISQRGNVEGTGIEVYGIDLKTGNLSAVQFFAPVAGGDNEPQPPLAVSLHGDFLYARSRTGKVQCFPLNADGTIRQNTLPAVRLAGTNGNITSLAPTLGPLGNNDNVVVVTTSGGTNNVALVANNGAKLKQVGTVLQVGNGGVTASSATLVTAVVNGAPITSGFAVVVGQTAAVTTAPHLQPVEVTNNLGGFAVGFNGTTDTLVQVGSEQTIGNGIGNLNGDPTTVAVTNNAGTVLTYVTTGNATGQAANNVTSNNVALFIPTAQGFASGIPNQVTTAAARSTTLSSFVDQSSRFLAVATDLNTLNVDLFEIASGGILDVPTTATAGSVPAGATITTLTQ